MGVLPTLFDGRTNHARAVLADIGSRYGLEVIDPPIPRSVRFAEAPRRVARSCGPRRRTPGAPAYRSWRSGCPRRGIPNGRGQ